MTSSDETRAGAEENGSPLTPPDEIRALAADRAEARRARDWATADRLRAQIEEAGWRLVDEGSSYTLALAHPPDLVEGPIVHYGSSASVPSRLDEPASARATVVTVITDQNAAEFPARGLGSVDDATQLVVVGEALAPRDPGALPTEEERVELVRMRPGLGYAAALNAGVRRASGEAIVFLAPEVEVSGDFVAPLVRALDDASIAVVGPWGLASPDLRRFRSAPAGDVDAIDGACLAFRRRDYLERGPLDEHFVLASSLDVWWSLVLRDEGPDNPPRRALALAGLPLARSVPREPPPGDDADRDRQHRRNFYRVLDRFGARRDLLVTTTGPRR